MICVGRLRVLHPRLTPLASSPGLSTNVSRETPTKRVLLSLDVLMLRVLIRLWQVLLASIVNRRQSSQLAQARLYSAKVPVLWV